MFYHQNVSSMTITSTNGAAISKTPNRYGKVLSKIK